MAVVEPSLVENSIIEAYDIFAGLGFEKTIIVHDYDLNTGGYTDHTFLGLQLNKDTIKVGREYQFLTEARPSVYFKGAVLNGKVPDHSQRLFQYIVPDRQYSVYSINEIFNFWIIRLKP